MFCGCGAVCGTSPEMGLGRIIMSNRNLILAGAAVVVLGGAVALYTTQGSGDGAAANTSPAVVHSTGPVPDFSSAGIGWRQENEGPQADNTGFNMAPGETVPGYISHHPDWPYAQNVVNRVGDFTSPLLTPWAAKTLEERARKVMAGGIPFIPNSRCWPGGVPGLHFFPAPIYLLQKPNQVWLLSNRGEVRRIYMDVPHSENPGYSWYGESVGHYENGNTLVVDTIGQDDKGPIDRYNVPHTKAIHVIERFTMDAERSETIVDITVEDPGAFTKPLHGIIRYGRATERGQAEPAQWEEYVCNENSEEFFIPAEELVPVPNAVRRDF
jgi:hypothetical protein